MGVCAPCSSLHSRHCERDALIYGAQRLTRDSRRQKMAFIATDISLPLDLMKNTTCYACRKASVRNHDRLIDLRKCMDPVCGKVQDFFMERCPHPDCSHTSAVPTWSIQGVSPDELVGKTYICSKKHANTMYECNATEVYEDSSDTPILSRNGFSIPLKTTATEFIAVVLAGTDLCATDFVLAMDVRRSPGMQTLNVLQDTELVYTMMMRHPDSTFIVFARSEYQQATDCPLFFAPLLEDDLECAFDINMDLDVAPASLAEVEVEVEDESTPAQFVLDDTAGMSAVHQWLEERGFTERRHLFETLAVGPLTLGPTYVDSVAVLVTEEQLNELFRLEFHASAVCPILIRNKYVLILLACDHNRNHQEGIYINLHDAARDKSPMFVEWIAEYQRQFGFGQFAAAAASLGEFVVGIDEPLEVYGATCEPRYSNTSVDEKAPLSTALYSWDESKLHDMERLYRERDVKDEEEDWEVEGASEEEEEESYEETKKKKRERPTEEEDKKEKRKRTKTSILVKNALRAIDFSIEHASKVVVCVKPMVKPDTPTPFAWALPNKAKDYYVFVPLRKDEAAQMPQDRLLGVCYKAFNLFYINCGSSVDRQQAVLAQVLNATGETRLATIASI